MKTALPILLVLLAVIVPATTTFAQENEEVLQLEIQVAKLRAEVARLNAMVMELRERVKMLERMIAEHDAPDVPFEEPEDEAAPGVRVTPAVPFGLGGGAAGTYVLDKEHLEKMAIEQMKKEMPGEGLGGTPEEQEEMMKSILQMIKVQISMMNLDIVLAPDGTFEASGAMGGRDVQATGTWSQDGDKITVVTTHEDGVKKDEPETQTATYKAGVITLKAGEEMPFDLRLLRK